MKENKRTLKLKKKITYIKEDKKHQIYTKRKQEERGKKKYRSNLVE